MSVGPVLGMEYGYGQSVVSMYYSANFGFVRPSLVERHGVELDKTSTEVRAPEKLIQENQYPPSLP